MGDPRRVLHIFRLLGCEGDRGEAVQLNDRGPLEL